MSRRRSTPYAILGLLSLRPMSGYDVRKESGESVGHFWSESYGQIYPALAELTSAGLARRRVERRPGKPDRHVYEISERGREALREWLLVAPSAMPVRSELLLKLFFGDEASAERQSEWVEQMLADATAQLETYARIGREIKREHPDDAHATHWRITLSYGVHRAEAHQRWARETLATLRSLARGARAKSEGQRAKTSARRRHA
jgi:PadR family transcriptional regulator, regulatory protein AphA